MPGATVMATGVQGSKNTVTDAEGRYTIPFLTPGVYSVRAELQGFKAVEQKDVSVRVGQTVDVPLKLEVGGVAEVVQVTGASRVVDTTSTTIGAVHQHGRSEVDSGRPHVQRRRCIWRPASAAPARSAPRTRRFPAAAASRISTSSTA